MHNTLLSRSLTRSLSVWAVLLFAALLFSMNLRPAKAEISSFDMGLPEFGEVAQDDSEDGEVLQAVDYSPLPLTSSNNQALRFTVKALEIQNGTWSYKASWTRTLDRQGSVYISPKTNRSTILRSVTTAGKTGETTVDLAPATRYRVEFYSQPNGQGTLLLRKYFNTLDISGNTVPTTQIPLERGGTLGTPTPTPTIITNTTPLSSATSTPLPGDPNLPIGKGGAKMNCPVPAAVPFVQSGSVVVAPIPRVYISLDMWQNCLGGVPLRTMPNMTNVSEYAIGADWTWLTFDNGMKLPNSLFQNIFNNYPPEVAYRKIYKILHFEPFANNPTVTSPDDPEAAINLPYYDPQIFTNSLAYTYDTGSRDTGALISRPGHKKFEGDIDLASSLRDPNIVTNGWLAAPYTGPGVTGLFPGMSYNARWEVKDTRTGLSQTIPQQFRTVPQTVDVYVESLFDYPTFNPTEPYSGGNSRPFDLTCAHVYWPSDVGVFSQYAPCRERMQARLAEEQQGKIFGFGGKGYVLVAQNVPYTAGKAQFFVPYPQNVTYPGKVTNKPYIGVGPTRIVVLDSRITPLINQYEGKIPFSSPAGGDYGAPSLTAEQQAWKTPITSLNVGQGILTSLLYNTHNLAIKMGTEGSLYPTSPMPWKVVMPGHRDDTSGWQYVNNHSRIITMEGGVGRPFWATINKMSVKETDWSPQQSTPTITFEGQVPPGLRLTRDGTYFQGTAGGVAAIIGTPSQAGTFNYDVITENRVGSKIIKGLTRYVITIRPTTQITQMTVSKVSGSEGNDFRVGDTVRITVQNDNGRIWGNSNPVLYIARVGGACNLQDPKSYHACSGQIGRHPDFVQKTPISGALLGQSCNNFTTGGNDPLIAWTCSEYQWVVGNVPGVDLSQEGDYVIYAAPSELGIYEPEGEGEFFYGNTQIHIKPGTTPPNNYSQYTPAPGGNLDAFHFDCAVNDRNVDCTRTSTGFLSAGQSSFTKHSSFFAMPGDRVTINYSARVTPERYPNATVPIPPNMTLGSDWSSTIQYYETGSGYGHTDASLKACTAFLVPGGFGRAPGAGGQAVDFTGVMNGPDGTISFTVPECMRGTGFIIRYTAHVGCSRQDGNLCASGGAFNFDMGVQIGGAGVPGGSGEVGIPGQCVLPSGFDSVSCFDPQVSGSGSSATASYRLRWAIPQASPNPVGTITQHVANATGYYVYAKSSPDRSEVENSNLLCDNAGNCNFSRQVSGFGNEAASETRDRIFTPLNRTNYVKLTAVCLGPSYTGAPPLHSEIATCAVGGTSGSPVLTATAATQDTTCRINPDMFNSFSGSSALDGSNFSAAWGGGDGTYDRLVFRAGTDLDAVLRGCTVEDLSSRRCIFKTGDPGSSYPNGIPANVTSIQVNGAQPDTTYWVRVAAVCDYGLPTQRVEDAIWQVATEGACSFGVLGNCP